MENTNKKEEITNYTGFQIENLHMKFVQSSITSEIECYDGCK